MRDHTQTVWNQVAEDYQNVFRLGSNSYNESLLRFWQEEKMIFPGCRVLDIGCGVGKYGVMLSRLGCDVTLTDISPEMLRYAEINLANTPSPWRTFLCDFHEVTGKEAPFSTPFDFTLSTMSPAISDLHSVKKMSEITKGTCFLACFCSWNQPLRDEIIRRAGRVPSCPHGDLRDHCENMSRMIASAGFTPKIKVVEYSWQDKRTPDEMTEYLLRHDFRGEADYSDWRQALYRASKEIGAGKEFLTDAVFTHVAWIWWQT